MLVTHFMRYLRVFCFLLTVLLLAGCDAEGSSSNSNPPSTSAPRLAVLSPALADTLHALGHAELIVGRQRFDRFTDPKIPVVGDLTGLDYERLIVVQPTHIVAQESANGLPARLIQLAEQRGWIIEVIPLLSLENTIASIRTLDQIAGGDGHAADALEERFRVALDRRKNLGRTALVASSSPLALIGPGAFHWEIVEQLGGTPIPQDGPAYFTTDAESLLDLNPQTIIAFAPGIAPDAPRADYLGVAADLNIDAIRQNRVILISDPKCMLPSTAMLPVIETILSEAERLGPPGDS